MLRPAAFDTPHRGARCQSPEIPLSTAPLFSLPLSAAPRLQPGFCLQRAHVGVRDRRSRTDRDAGLRAEESADNNKVLTSRETLRIGLKMVGIFKTVLGRVEHSIPR